MKIIPKFISILKKSVKTFIQQNSAKLILKTEVLPSRCGSVGWSIIPQTKSSWFDSQPGDLPRMQVQSLFGARTRRQPIDISLSFSLLSSLSISNEKKISLGEDFLKNPQNPRCSGQSRCELQKLHPGTLPLFL